MKILLSLVVLSAALSSCGMDSYHGPGASDSRAAGAAWNPPVEAQPEAGEIVSGVPQPPRR